MVKKYRKNKKHRKLRIERIPKNQYSTLNCMVEAWMPVTSVAAGGYGYTVALNFPTFWRNSAATYIQMTNVPANFAGLLAIFDEIKVHSLRTRFISNYTDTAYTTTDVPDIVYITNDIDDSVLPNEPAMLNVGVQPIRISALSDRTNVFKQTRQNKGIYQNTGIILANNPALAVIGNAVPLIQAYASVKYFFPSLPVTQTMGRIYARWHCTFRGLRNV